MSNVERLRRIQEVLAPEWTPDRDTSRETEYAGWIQDERIKAIERIVSE